MPGPPELRFAARSPEDEVRVEGVSAACEDVILSLAQVVPEAQVSRAGKPQELVGGMVADHRTRCRRRCLGRLLASTSVGLASAAGVCAVLDFSFEGGSSGDLGEQLPLVAGLALAAVLVEHAPFLLERRVRPAGFARRPEPPAPWSPWLPGPPPRAALACLETALVLGKFLVFLAFAARAESYGYRSTLAWALATASRVCLIVDAVLCAAMGASVGLCMGTLPNVFPDDGLDMPRNLLSIQLVAFGAVIGALGVGLRGLRYGDLRVDACIAAGVHAPPRLLAVLVLDLPHLVLGCILLVDDTAGSDGQGHANVLAAAAIAAGLAGLALGAKTCLVDCRWFWYGFDFRRRAMYLTQKGYASARWSAMTTTLRKAKHEVRVRREELERAKLASKAPPRPRPGGTERPREPCPQAANLTDAETGPTS